MEPVGLWRLLAAGDRRKVAVVAASVLLVVLIGVMLARLVWLVAAGPVSTVAESPAPAPVAVRSQAPRYSPEMAANWRLFGDAAAQSAIAAGPEDAPATNLSLQLLGTFSTGDTRLAGAVIAERGKDGDLYRIGATLPGGAVLEKVEADKVLMRRRGQLETLSFDAAPTNAAGEAAVGSAVVGGVRSLRERLGQFGDDGGDPDDPQSKARTVLAGLSDSLRSNPEGVLSELGLRPVNANQASGYLVSDGTNGEMMRSLGLRPGDVVLSVNGKPLGSVRNDARLVDEVKASGEARVEIRRGSQTFTVNYPL